MWRASVLTLFPEMFPGPLDVSLIGKARADGQFDIVWQSGGSIAPAPFPFFIPLDQRAAMAGSER